MFKNWKTTLTGLIGLGTQLVPFLQGAHITLHDIPTLMVSIGLLFAKDWNVTGGTVAQSPTPGQIVKE